MGIKRRPWRGGRWHRRQKQKRKDAVRRRRAVQRTAALRKTHAKLSALEERLKTVTRDLERIARANRRALEPKDD